MATNFVAKFAKLADLAFIHSSHLRSGMYLMIEIWMSED